MGIQFCLDLERKRIIIFAIIIPTIRLTEIIIRILNIIEEIHSVDRQITLPPAI